MLHSIPEENLAVVQFITQALANPAGKALPEARVHEFEQFQYLMQQQKGPAQLAFISLASGQPLPQTAKNSVADACKSFAQLTNTVEGYQLTHEVCAHAKDSEGLAVYSSLQRLATSSMLWYWQVHLELLRSLSSTEQDAALAKLGALRKLAVISQFQ